MSYVECTCFKVAVYEDEYGMHIDKFTSNENRRTNWLKSGANLLKPLCDYFKEKMLKVKSVLCWSHVRAIFKYVADISKDDDAAWFVEQMGRLYMIESENILLHRTVDEIKQRCSKNDITKILSSVYDRACKMVKNKHCLLWRLDG